MQVLDHQPHSWFLLKDGDALLFDAACSNGAFGYSWLIELNAGERQAYERGGRAFLDWLAHDIHNGVPILKISQLSCPLLSGPSTMTVWIEEGTTNACQEAQARGDHRQAA